MNRSETIKELASALCKFQSVMENVTKDSSNPFFKSKYADLASCWDAIKKPLTDNGLSITQPIGGDERGDFVETVLMHTSGEWMSGRMYLKKPAKDDMQTLGAATTYARRFSLCAITGLCPEDDDGNLATGKSKEVKVDKVEVEKVEVDPVKPRANFTQQFFQLCKMATTSKIPPGEVKKYLEQKGYDVTKQDPINEFDWADCVTYFSTPKV